MSINDYTSHWLREARQHGILQELAGKPASREVQQKEVCCIADVLASSPRATHSLTALAPVLSKYADVMATQPVTRDPVTLYSAPIYHHDAVLEALCRYQKLAAPKDSSVTGSTVLVPASDTRGEPLLYCFVSEESLRSHLPGIMGSESGELPGIAAAEMDGVSLFREVLREPSIQQLLLRAPSGEPWLLLAEGGIPDALKNAADGYQTAESIRALADGRVTPANPLWEQLVRNVLDHNHLVVCTAPKDSSHVEVCGEGGISQVPWPAEAAADDPLYKTLFTSMRYAVEFHHFHQYPALAAHPHGDLLRSYAGMVAGAQIWSDVVNEDGRVIVNAPSFSTVDGKAFAEEYQAVLAANPGYGQGAVVVDTASSSGEWLREAARRGILQEMCDASHERAAAEAAAEDQGTE